MAVTTAYDGLAPEWDAAAGLVYRPLARSLVAASPVALAGCLVLDVGSGTGAVAQAAAARGARVVAVDRSTEMVSYGSAQGWPAVVADVLALPLRDGVCDAAAAGFLLNHLPPAAALAELARVVRPGGVVLASTWAGGQRDAAKAAIDAVVAAWGWVPPALVPGDAGAGAAGIRESGTTRRDRPAGRPGLGASLGAPRGPRPAGFSRGGRLPPGHAADRSLGGRA